MIIIMLICIYFALCAILISRSKARKQANNATGTQNAQVTAGPQPVNGCYGSAANQRQVSSVADEIMGLKRLADSGIITQEEFEAKKRQLLRF